MVIANKARYGQLCFLQTASTLLSKRKSQASLLLVLVVDINDLLHLVVRAHEDSRLVVD